VAAGQGTRLPLRHGECIGKGLTEKTRYNGEIKKSPTYEKEKRKSMNRFLIVQKVKRERSRI